MFLPYMKDILPKRDMLSMTAVPRILPLEPFIHSFLYYSFSKYLLHPYCQAQFLVLDMHWRAEEIWSVTSREYSQVGNVGKLN